MAGIEEFLDELRPIIIRAIRRERIRVRCGEWQDLMQEGNLAALEAVKAWQAGGPKKTVDIKTWAAIYVKTRFKELKKINFVPEILVEDIEALPEKEDEGFEAKNPDEDIIRLSLYALNPKYRDFLERALDWSLPQAAIAKDMRKKRQRISQLKRDVKKAFNRFSNERQCLG